MSVRTSPRIYIAVLRPGAVEGPKVVRVGLLNEEPGTLGFDVNVLGFKFEDDEKKADQVTITIDNYDLSQLDGDLWDPGNIIAFQFGYPGLMSPIYKATIVVVKGFHPITVEADGMEVVMGRVERTDRVWEHVRRSDVVRELARQYGFDESEIFVEDSPYVVESVTQAGMTDHQLIRDLATREGCEFYVDAAGLHFKTRDLAQTPTRVFTYFVDPGEGDILSISMETDKRLRKAGAVTAAGKDATTGQPFEVTGDNASTSDRTALVPTAAAVGPQDTELEKIDGPTGTTHVVQVPLVKTEGQATKQPTSAKTEGEAQHGVNATYKRDALKGATVTVKVVGDPLLKAKTVIRLERVGTKLGGNWYVKSAVHELGADYTTTLKCGRDNLKDGVGTTVKATVNDKPGPPKDTPGAPVELVPKEVVDPVTNATKTIWVPKGSVAV